MRLYVIVFLWAFCMAGIVIFFYRREQKLLRSLQKMLDDAISGRFEEPRLDESGLSALENSMWRYLCGNELSYQRLKEQKEQMQAFLSDLSHQAVTPVSNILLYSQLLEEWKREAEDKMQELYFPAEEIEAIQEQAQKLDFFIQSFVKLSRLETGIITVNVKYQEIRPVLLSIKQQYLPKAEQKGIRFELKETGEVSGAAVFDRKWTVEAVGNIVDNAIKYTPASGKVSINIEEYVSFLRIDVIDTGIGILEKEQGNIFTRFYRSPEVSEQTGLGLGLYLAREVVRAQNGYIKVTSSPGKGSAFSIFLPKYSKKE